MDYIKISKWIQNVIMSCKTLKQLESAEKLLTLYKQQTERSTYIYTHRFLNHTLEHQINKLSYGSNRK